MKTFIALSVAAPFLFLSILAKADSFVEKCPDIPTCAKVVGEMLGQKYMFDADVKGKVQGTPNLDLTKDNAELLFTNMLNLEGFTRVPLNQPSTFQILRQRDARDSAIPLIRADKTHAPALPNNWDMVTLLYKASHPEVVEQIARMSRSFMPANSRIIPSELSGTLLVTDSAANLKKLYEIVRDEDQKPTAEMKKRWEEESKRRMAEAMQKKHEEAKAVPAPAPSGKASN